MANDWMAQGNCADKPPSLFFPSDGVGVEVAKRLCVTCAVRMECLEYALRNRIDHGVWGGTSERERRRILKSRRLQIGSGLRVEMDCGDMDRVEMDRAEMDRAGRGADLSVESDVDLPVGIDVDPSPTGEIFSPHA